MKKITFILILLKTMSFANIPPNNEIGIHKLQSMYYQTTEIPISEKLTVFNGIDILLEKKLHFIQSRTIALVTNHTGIDRDGIPNYERLMKVDGVDLKVIFSPEHCHLVKQRMVKKSIMKL